jgi:hypothetical protein
LTEEKKQFKRGQIAIPTNSAKETGHLQINLDLIYYIKLNFISSIKINLKDIMDSNVMFKTKKLQEHRITFSGLK